MLESVPAPIQVVLWPLAGAMLILVLRRLLPNWLRRVVALVAVLMALSALWSLGPGGAEPVAISWEPLNFFRTSPILQAGSLGLFSGALLCTVTALLVLGIRGNNPRHTGWHGLILIALAGSLLATLSGNLLSLAMGSGLLDLGLVALVISSEDGPGRVAWRMVVPGAASTLLILICAVQMDAQVGSTSLMARDFPVETLLLVGVAGLLRLLIFPLHARNLDRPEEAATLLLPVGTGLYLLARAQTIGPVLADRPWMLALGGVALLAGGLMAWSGTTGKARMAATWSGIAIHQTGLALIYVLLVRPPIPWPWVGLALALGALATWWAGTEPVEEPVQPRWFNRLAEWIAPPRDRAKAAVSARMPSSRRWRESWLGQHLSSGLAAIALLSLTGVPWTAGAVARWPFYAALLRNGQGGLLIAAIAGDTLLIAGLWTLLSRTERTSPGRKVRLGPILSLLFFDLLLLAVGLAPGKMTGSLGVKPPATPDVSAWGLGFVFVLPWLFGAWLTRVRSRLGHPAEILENLVQLQWLYRAVSRVGQALVGTMYWVGAIGEGEGWWGWALIILALGALFFTAR